MNHLLQSISGCLIALLMITSSSAQSDLIFSVSDDWAFSSGGGYVPLEITATTADGTPVNREVHLNFCASYSYGYYGNIHSTSLVIPAGKSRGTARLYFAPETSMKSYTWWVESDFNSKLDPRERIRVNSGGGIAASQPDGQCFLFLSSSVVQAIPARVFWQPTIRQIQRVGGSAAGIGEDMPSYEVLHSILPSSSTFNTFSANGNAAKGVARNHASIQLAPPMQLPTNWVELSAVQHVVISLDELKDLEKQSPERIEMLRRWIATGGRLIVNQCGPDSARANQIFGVLKIQPEPSPTWTWLSEPTWKYVSRNTSFIYYTDTVARNQFGVDVDVFGELRIEIEENAKKMRQKVWDESTLPAKTGEDGSQGIRVRRFLRGQIVAVDDSMADWDKMKWGRLLATMQMIGPDFSALTGEKAQIGSIYGAPVIPGVKDPPRSAFQFLIICFVLVAGPLNYFLLHRMRRINALLITVPIISIGACLALVAYAFFVQGFGIKSRHDSVTVIDQRTKMAVSRSLHTISSGVSPGKHEFDVDQYVLSATEGRERTKFVHQGEKVVLSGGGYKARSPYQFTVVDSYECNDRIQVAIENGKPVVKSQFANPIGLLVLRYGGELYVVDNLDPDQTTQPDLVSLAKAKERYRDVVEQFKGQEHRRRTMRQMGIIGSVIGDPDLEELISDGSYVAVLGKFDGAQPIRKKLSHYGGVHVVVGKW